MHTFCMCWFLMQNTMRRIFFHFGAVSKGIAIEILYAEEEEDKEGTCCVIMGTVNHLAASASLLVVT